MRYMENLFAYWQLAIKQQFDLVTDPEEHWRKLVDLAMLAHERLQVSSDELSDMLELADAARLWGLVEWEEADGAGLFLEYIVDPDNVSFFCKKGQLSFGRTPGRGEYCVGGEFGEWLIMAEHRGASLQRALDAKP